jgi:hypothetical protein
MKKLLLFLLSSSYIYSLNQSIVYISKPANINQMVYDNMIELPFGFSVDLHRYDNVIWMYDSEKLRSVALSNYDTNDTLWLGTYPFGVPLVGKRDIYQESEFLSEITKPTDNVTIALYGNSTFYVYKLNDGYKAYVVASGRYDDILAAIFRDSKFIVSFFLDRNDKKTIENILYSIKQNDKLFSKENYLKNIRRLHDNSNLQRALLYSSVYYIYDKNDNENRKLFNKITNEIILSIARIKNEINE